MENNIKTIVPTTCPHCGKDMFVEFQSKAPELLSVFDPQQVAAFKKDAIERINALSVDDELKQKTIKWIEDEETVFGPNEIESIIMSLLKPQE